MIPTDKRRHGFTFVELLLVIGLLGILSMFFISTLVGGQAKGRDVKRKGDISKIQKALELYRQCHDPPSYPSSLPSVNSTWAQASGDATATCPASSTVYMTLSPGDPSTGLRYYYSRSGLTYTLCACLENANDMSSSTSAGNCSATYICTSGRRYLVSER